MMNNTLKITLLNFLLLAPCAMHAMNPLRNFGAKAFQTVSATAAKFKLSTKAFKTKVFTHKQPTFKTFTSHNSGGKRYNNFKSSVAAMPVLKAGVFYGAYDRIKSWFGYGESRKNITEKYIEENIQKPECKEEFIAYIIEHLENIEIKVLTALLQQYPDAAEKIAAAAIKKIKEHAGNNNFGYWFSLQWGRLINALQETVTVCPRALSICAHHNLLEGVSNEGVLWWVIGASVNDSLEKIVCTVLESREDKTIDAFLKNNAQLLDHLYARSDEKGKKILKEKMRKIISRRIPNFVFMPEGASFNEKTLQFIRASKYPLWAYDLKVQKRKHNTQSEAHFLENMATMGYLLKKLPQDAAPFFLNIHKKELEERAQGNYVFYHAQAWPRHMSADFYKLLWNITKKDYADDNFTFTRFSEPWLVWNIRNDSLYMNHALLGNSRRFGSCTAHYFFNNRSINTNIIPAKVVFKQLGLSKYFCKYKNEIEAVEQLHQQANIKGRGNLMLISVSPKTDISWKVLPVEPGGDLTKVPLKDGRELNNTAAILEALVKEPQNFYSSYLIEYAMPITTDFALNPKNGPRFYTFHNADKTKLKEYETARDALFAKIKKDYEQDQDKK